MNASPMMMRIAELRISSSPMIGPTVRTSRGSPGPNCSSRSAWSSANSVPSAIGTGVGSGVGGRLRRGGRARRVGPREVPEGVGLTDGDAAADGLTLADGGADPDGDGSGRTAGSRSIGSVRMRR